MDQLAERVASLERQLRRWKRGGAFLLIGVAAVVAMGQAATEKVPDAIRTRALLIVDDEGRTWARLDTSGLCLFEPDGDAYWERANLNVGNGRAQLLLNPNYRGGSHGVCLESRSEGSGSLELGRRVELETGEGEQPRLRLGHRDSGSRIELRLAEDGSPFLGLYDKRSEVRLRAFWSALLDEAGLHVLGKDGEVRFRTRRE